jgi:hypothetical protein
MHDKQMLGFVHVAVFFFLSFFSLSRFQSLPLYIFKAALEFFFFSDLIHVPFDTICCYFR